jgi:hypothetical protein
MTAWATIVAERLGFEREEALSIGAYRQVGMLDVLKSHEASVYTEMNAISKGVSLGLFDKSRQKEIEPIKGSTQPYVDLLGRRYASCQVLVPLIDSVTCPDCWQNVRSNLHIYLKPY